MVAAWWATLLGGERIDLCEGGIDVCGERLLRVRTWQNDWADKIRVDVNRSNAEWQQDI